MKRKKGFARGSRSSMLRATMNWRWILWVVGFIVGVSGCGGATQPRCRDASVAVQVLGSGGPIADDARASSGYVIWIDGQSRLLVDAGGGVFQRFGEAGASLDQLEAVALTHLHADHSADLAALLKSGYFAERSRPLPIIGPSGRGDFPPTDAFLRALLDPERGAFAYLSPYLSGTPTWFHTPVTVEDADDTEPRQVLATDEMRLHAVGVHHGRIPALGFLVEAQGWRIGFAGDQTGDNHGFHKMVSRADLLVMHHAIPEKGFDGVRSLHVIPSEMGRIAERAQVSHLVLSHHMQRALAEVDTGRAAIEAQYDGPVTIADDLQCFPMHDPHL